MNLERWIDSRVSSVRVADLRDYLLCHGWKPQLHPRPETLVFLGPIDDSGEPILLMMPANERFRDYGMRIAEIITTLSVLEDRHPVEILDETLRRPSTESPLGSIPQGEGNRAIVSA